MKFRFFAIPALMIHLSVVAPSALAAFITYGSWNTEFYSIDLDTMVASDIPINPSFFQLDFTSDGTLYAMSRSSDALYRIPDPEAGTVEFLSTLPFNSIGEPMTISPDDRYIYYVETIGLTSAKFYRYGIATMVNEFVGNMALPDAIGDFDFGPDGNLYATTVNSRQLFKLDLNTLTGVDFGPVNFGMDLESGASLNSMSFGPDGVLYAMIDPTTFMPGDPPDVYLATININDGVGIIDLSQRLWDGSRFIRASGLAIMPTVVPEPSTFGYFLIAMLFAVARLKSRLPGNGNKGVSNSPGIG